MTSFPEPAWSGHPWLSRLVEASDADGDFAVSIFSASETALTALRRVRLQYQDESNNWLEAETCFGNYFTGLGWAQASISWYPPLNRDSIRAARALVPKEWTCPEPPKHRVAEDWLNRSVWKQ